MLLVIIIYSLRNFCSTHNMRDFISTLTRELNFQTIRFNANRQLYIALFHSSPAAADVQAVPAVPAGNALTIE